MNESTNEIPQFLYHYTSINNLALILKNKTIRFSCLEALNDLTEGETSDYGKIGQYIFTSCWTETPEEHIPLWNMYTPKMAGVRIKLPKDPFRRYLVSGFKGRNKTADFLSIVPEEEIFGKEYSVTPQTFMLHKVSYTEDKNLLNPEIYKQHGNGGESLNFHLLGKHKSTSWRFESEWRYLFWIFPSTPSDIVDENYYDKMFSEFSKVFEKKALPLNQYFLKMHDEAFEQMEIVLGPKHSTGDIAVVESLISSYNPNAKFKLSSLTGKIK